MAAKIVAVSHGMLAAILFCFATTIPQSQAVPVYFSTVACGVVAYGCWTQRRRIAALGAVPLALFAIAAGTMANGMPGFFTSREAGAIEFMAFSVVILEIIAIAVAGKSFEPTAPSSE